MQCVVLYMPHTDGGRCFIFVQQKLEGPQSPHSLNALILQCR